MANKRRKICVLLVAALLTFSFSTAVLADENSFDVEENSKQRSELKQEASDFKEKIDLTEQEIEEKLARSEELQEQINQLSTDIKESNETIKTLNTEIKEKQALIDEKLKETDDILDLLRKRLRAVHTAGDTSSLEIILGSKSFSDFIDKSEMIQSMSEYDTNLISTIKEQMSVIADDQKELKTKKAKVEDEKTKLEKDKEKINELFDENTSIIEELNLTKDKLENDLKENKEKQKELSKALAEYRKQQAAEAAAARKAAREAEREAARRARAANNSSDGSTDDAADDSSDEYYDDEDYYEPEIVTTPDSDGSWVWPCPGFTYLTSTFDEWRGSNNHGALDIADSGIYGAKVVACYDGVVFSTCDTCTHDYGKFESCGCGGGYGNYVMIDHGDGKISIYGHLSGVTVYPGQYVSAGQLIGYVGSTGYSTGAHLHFETQYNGVRYDPLSEY